MWLNAQMQEKNEVFDPNLQFPTVDQKANNSFSIAFPKPSKCLGT